MSINTDLSPYGSIKNLADSEKQAFSEIASSSSKMLPSSLRRSISGYALDASDVRVSFDNIKYDQESSMPSKVNGGVGNINNADLQKSDLQSDQTIVSQNPRDLYMDMQPTSSTFLKWNQPRGRVTCSSVGLADAPFSLSESNEINNSVIPDQQNDNNITMATNEQQFVKPEFKTAVENADLFNPNLDVSYPDYIVPESDHHLLNPSKPPTLDHLFGDIKKDELVSFLKILETSYKEGFGILDLSNQLRKHISSRSISTPAVKDWNKELQSILEMEPSEHKYTKLRELANDFNLTAEVYAKILISELFLSPSEKTIPPSSIGGIAGGTKFICQGILFKFAIDVQLPETNFWMYGKHHAATEYAMKAAGSELRHLVALSNVTGDTDFRVPLMALIDYRGFRLVASSLLPIGTHTIIYGSDNGGANVYTDPEASRMFDQVANRLNLKKHRFGDAEISGPVDIEIHRGEDQRLYIIDVARLFPCEAPELGLIAHPRANYFRMLRPRLVGKYHEPLSSDAFSGFGRHNEEIHNREVYEATKFLIDSVIPEVADNINEGNYKIKTCANLCQVVHKAGINLRYLGLLRTFLKDQSNSSVSETFKRQSIPSSNLFSTSVVSTPLPSSPGAVMKRVQSSPPKTQVKIEVKNESNKATISSNTSKNNKKITSDCIESYHDHSSSSTIIESNTLHKRQRLSDRTEHRSKTIEGRSNILHSSCKDMLSSNSSNSSSNICNSSPNSPNSRDGNQKSNMNHSSNINDYNINSSHNHSHNNHNHRSHTPPPSSKNRSIEKKPPMLTRTSVAVIQTKQKSMSDLDTREVTRQKQKEIGSINKTKEDQNHQNQQNHQNHPHSSRHSSQSSNSTSPRGQRSFSISSPVSPLNFETCSNDSSGPSSPASVGSFSILNSSSLLSHSKDSNSDTINANSSSLNANSSCLNANSNAASSDSSGLGSHPNPLSNPFSSSNSHLPPFIYDIPKKSAHSVCQLVLTEMIARTLKSKLRQIWRRTMQRHRISIEAPFANAAIDMLNMTFYKLGEESESFWKNTLIEDLKRKYRVGLTEDECSGSYSLYELIDPYELFNRFISMVGIKINWNNEMLTQPDRRFMYTDIESINCIVTPMNLVTVSEGILLSMMASAEKQRTNKLELLNMAEIHLTKAFTASFNPIVTAELGNVHYARISLGIPEIRLRDAEAAFLCYNAALTQYKQNIKDDTPFLSSVPVLSRMRSINNVKAISSTQRYFINTTVIRLLEVTLIHLYGNANLVKLGKYASVEELYTNLGRWMGLVHRYTREEEKEGKGGGEKGIIDEKEEEEGEEKEEEEGLKDGSKEGSKDGSKDDFKDSPIDSPIDHHITHNPLVSLIRTVFSTPALPMLLEILQYTSRDVLTSVRQELSSTPSISLKDQTASFGTYDSSFHSLIESSILADKLFSMPKLRALDLTNCYTVTNKVLETILPIAPNLTSLNLTRCRRITNHLASIIAINRMTPLVELNLSHCNITDDFFFEAAPLLHSITSLNISYCPRITETVLFVLSRKSTNLSSLSVAGCLGITSFQSLELFWALEYLDCSKNAHLESSHILPLLNSSRSFILKRLLLSGNTQIGDETFMIDAQMNLTELRVNETSITCETIIKLLNFCPDINILDISDCPKLNLGLLGERPFSFNELTELYMKGQSAMWAGETISELKKSLRVIEMSGAGSGIQHLLFKPNPCQLTSIGLLRCNDILASTLVEIGNLTSLTSLNMAGCVHLTDSTLQHILAELAYLTTLELPYCSQITTSALQTIGKSCPMLTVLDLDHCRSIEDPKFHEIGYSCLGLTDLRLSRIALTTSGMRSLFRGGLKTLRNLKLKDCGLTDETLKEISTNSPALVMLDLSDNSELRSPSIRTLFSNCRYLEDLWLTGVQHLSDEAFPKSSKRRLHSLRTISLSGCKNITDATVNLIARRCPLIKSLNMSWCSEITAEAVKNLMQSCELLVDLRLVCCDNIPPGKLDTANTRTLPVLKIQY